jgi:hypothetical protein
MGIEMGLFEAQKLNPLDFWLWSWLKIEVYRTEVDTPDELFALIFYVAGCIKKRDDQL